MLGNFRHFGACICSILHNLGIVARVYANADDPLAVAKAATTQQYLIRVDWDERAVVQRHLALKLVQVLIGSLTVDVHARKVIKDIVFSLCEVEDALLSLLMLQVSLPIQVLRLNVGDTFGQRARN